MSYIHLRCHSAYSLLSGALKLPQIIDLCKKHAMPAVSLADENNLFGSLEFSQMATKNGIQPIIASIITLAPREHQAGTRLIPEQCDQLLLIAKDDVGYANLVALSSESYTSPYENISPIISYDQLFALSEGIIALSSGIYGGIGKALLSGRKHIAEKLCAELKQHFPDRFYIELMRHDLPDEQRIEPTLLAMAVAHDLPLVATNNVYFSDVEMTSAHDALMAVAHGRYVSEDDRPRLNKEHRFKSAEEMKLLFADIPEAIENTVHIAKRCAVMAPSRAPILPSFYMEDEAGNVLSESDSLTRVAEEGLQERLEKHVFNAEMSEAEKAHAAQPYRERLAYELDVIITMKFPGYFLIVSDFIRWAKEHRIPVGPGRGSGAGSLVAWSLSITDLDPLRYGLIFERFLNPERVSMPDFDIDFCQERRDLVIRYVQEKYGSDKVAQIITFGKLQARAVLRDVGRVLQMPYGQVDKICKLVPNNPAASCTLPEAIQMEPLLKQAIKDDDQVAQLVELSKKLEGLYRHASTHAAGVVIADRPLQELVPIYRDPKSDMPVVQYSMKYAEEAGLVKFDFLGLKTLSVIQQCADFIGERGIEIDIETLPEGDLTTYAMLTKGQTVGVFQFESAGMQDALKKLKPDCIEDLIALSALYRPGPMDNIPAYIDCKHGRQEPDYLHPMLEEVLKETYGVIIYQEQVQKIAQIMAGYTLGAADLLRRAMGKKIKAEMDAQRATFVDGAKANGVDGKQASGIFDLVAKFAGYGFNKSHSAAYSVIAYQTAYLKANYPVDFLAASMNYDLQNTDKLAIFKQEADALGIAILPPDVNHSKALFSVEKQADDTLAVRYGLAAVKNVGQVAMEALVAEREENGEFKSVSDMAERVESSAMNRRQLENLICAGGFDQLHNNRAALCDAIDQIIGLNSEAQRNRESQQVSLFGGLEEAGGDAMPETLRIKPMEDWAMTERLQREQSALGYFLSAHPLEGYTHVLDRLKTTASNALEKRLSAEYGGVKLAGIVGAKKVKRSAKGKFAFITMSDAFGNYELSVFDEEMLAEKAELFEVGQMLYVNAEGKSDEGGVRLIAKSVRPLMEVAEETMPTQSTFHITSTHAVKTLHEKLRPAHNEEGKGMRIFLIAPLSESEKRYNMKIKLPDHYAINAETLAELKM